MHSVDGGVDPQPRETAHSELKSENARLQLLLNLTNHITDSASGSFTVHALDYPQGKGYLKKVHD